MVGEEDEEERKRCRRIKRDSINGGKIRERIGGDAQREKSRMKHDGVYC